MLSVWLLPTPAIATLLASESAPEPAISPDLPIRPLARSAPAAAIDLQLSATEQDFLRAHGPQLRAVYFENPPFAMTRDGMAVGYTIDLLQQAASLLGLQPELRPALVADGITAIADGSADLLLDLVHTRERAQVLRYGTRSGLIEWHIFQHRDAPPLDDLPALAGQRVAVWPGAAALELLADLDPPPRRVWVQRDLDALRAVAKGDADGTILEVRHARHLIGEHLLTDIRELPSSHPGGLAPRTASFFAVHRTAETLGGLLDRALAALPSREIDALQGQWFDDPQGFRSALHGVQLTPAERDFLAAHRDLVLGIDGGWLPWVIENPDGSMAGIVADTLALVNEALGTNIGLATGPWAPIVAQAEARAIDGLAATVVHPARAGQFLFTRSYAELGRGIWVRAGNPLGIRTLADLAGKRVGYQAGNLDQETRVRAVPGAQPEPRRDQLDLINGLLSGELDALVEADTLGHLLANRGIGSVELAFLLPEQTQLVFAVRNDWPLLVSAIDRVLAALPAAERLAIRARYMASTPAPQVPLTAAERDYLRARDQRLRYCFHPSWVPYDYLQDGTHHGIFREHLELLGDKLGVTFEPVATADWSAALEGLRAGACEFLSGAVATPERRADFAFTAPFMDLTMVLIGRIDQPFVTGIEELLDAPIAVSSQAAAAQMLRARYPRIQLLEIDGYQAAAELLSSRQIAAIVAELIHAGNLVDQRVDRYRIIGKLDLPYPISLAVRRDDRLLLTILDKAIAATSQAERDTLARRWTRFTIEEQVDLTPLWQGLGVACLLALLLLYRQHALARINRALAAARDAAEAAAAAKGRFLAHMGHELRTPMNAILGMTRLCLDTDLGTHQRHYLERVQGAGQALLGIIEDVLDLARIEAGKLELEQRPFVIDELFEALHGLVGLEAQARGLDLDYALDPGLPLRLTGDPLRLQQLLMNLTGNALKFTPAGRVVVSVEFLGAPAAAAIDLCFSVTDTGIGIEPELREQLFSAFTQADQFSVRRYQGLGLGLAISKELVVRMGGEIGVDSQPGHGSRFWFSVRLGVPATSPPPWQGNHPVRGRRVMVLEPRPERAAALQRTLAAFGLDTSLATTPAAALQALCKHPADLLLVATAALTGGPPGAAGPDATTALLATATPVVLLTDLYTGPPVPPVAATLARTKRPGLVSELYLPLTRERLFAGLVAVVTGQPAAATEDTPATLPPLPAVQVLLAEDNPVNREYLEELLRRAGARVAVARNGREAVRCCVSDRFDAVLMDLQMPELDGLTATRAIRAMRGNARLPIIAITAHGGSADRAACTAAGIDDVLTKPITPEALLATLSRWLSDVAAADTDQPAADDPAANHQPGTATLSRTPDETPSTVPDAPLVATSSTLLPASPPGQPGRSGLDLTAGLQRTGGDPNLYRRVLAAFYDHHRQDPSRLRTAAANGDEAALRALSHQLKGVAGLIGAQALHQTGAALLRQPALTNDTDGPTALLVALLLELEQVLHETHSTLLLAQAAPSSEAVTAVAAPGR